MFVAIVHVKFEYGIWTNNGFDISSSAVVAFYFLSGYLITKNIESGRYGSKIYYFYLDRVIRIYPIFWIVIISFCISNYFLKSSIISMDSVEKIILHSTIVGDLLLTGSSGRIIAPTFSLAIEMIFYIFIPFLIRFKEKKIYRIFIFSIFLINATYINEALGFQIIFLNSYQKSYVFYSYINNFLTSSYAYHSIYFVLHFFIIGVLHAKKSKYFYRCVAILITSNLIILLIVNNPSFYSTTGYSLILGGGY